MMRLIILLALFSFACAKEEDNEITPPRPPINLDSNLRRALLKALTELENEEIEKERQKTLTHIDLPQIDTKDKIIEKASASALSFYAKAEQESTTTENINTTTEDESETPIFIIQRSKGIQQKPITTVTDNYSPDPVNEAEQILTSASSSFTSNNKYFSKTSSGNNKNFVTNSPNNYDITDNKITTTFSKPPKMESTTVSIPTPSTEENEAKVEDVQFFSAPLVAAFTVHQDERGLPKSVVPIYKSTQKVELKTNNNNQKFLPNQSTPQLQPIQPNNNNQKFLTNQLAPQLQHIPPLPQPLQPPVQEKHQQSLLLQQQQQRQQEQFNAHLVLQQKQKALEEEISRLKQQQQQQNYLIKQQQLLHEQQLLLQRQKLEEQLRNYNNQQPFIPISNQFNQSNRNQFQTNTSGGVKGNLVSFQPSISLNPTHQTNVLPLNAQELPIKNPINFRTPFSQQPQFNFATQQQQQLPLVNTANFNNFNSLSPNTLKHNRVFRQEPGTGNFFNNNNFNNQFSQFPVQQPQPQQNRFFRSNLESSLNFNRPQPPVVNQHLNNLLYNSGIYRDKQIEDLNIVSKVLSLNHFGGDYRFSGSNINEQRVPFVKKV